MAEKSPTNPRGAGKKRTPAAEYQRLMVRLPVPMHEDVRALAEEDVRSFNGTLIVLLDFALQHYPYTREPVHEDLREPLMSRKAVAS